MRISSHILQRWDQRQCFLANCKAPQGLDRAVPRAIREKMKHLVFSCFFCSSFHCKKTASAEIYYLEDHCLCLRFSFLYGQHFVGAFFKMDMSDKTEHIKRTWHNFGIFEWFRSVFVFSLCFSIVLQDTFSLGSLRARDKVCWVWLKYLVFCLYWHKQGERGREGGVPLQMLEIAHTHAACTSCQQHVTGMVHLISELRSYLFLWRVFFHSLYNKK